jgi:lipoprotein-releasing system permease protein
MIAIALGVAVLIIVLSVMNGFREELLSRLLGINGHVTVFPERVGEGIEDFDALAALLRGVEQVERATPLIEKQVMLTAAGKARGALVRGIRPDDLRRRDLVAAGTDADALDRFGAEDGVLLGYRLARALGVSPGDSVTLISPEGRATVLGTVPRARAYPVLGTFNLGMSEYDGVLVFMPLAQAQLHFRLPEMVTQIEVVTDDADTAWLTAQNITAAASGRAYASSWHQRFQHLANALQVERNVMFLILALIILIAAFNIIGSLIMLVHDKGKGIAILRTMGASSRSIMRIFFLTGAAIGVVGTFAGLVLGLLFTDNIQTIQAGLEGLIDRNLFPAEIYYLSRLPAKIDPNEVIMVVLMGLGLSFLATIYPAWRAAKLDPVEALRYE